MNPDQVTYFGETDFRGQQASFGIRNEDRSRHVYVIGKTGMGKSTLLENMAAQDIQNGEGMCFIDPHGSAIDTLLEYIPEHRIKDVVYFAPFDSDFPIAFNVMEDIGIDQRHLVVSGLMSAFKKIWVDAWSARMEHILNNTILALLEYPGSTLLAVNRMYADKGFREEVVSKVTDPAVRSFWNEEFAKWDERFMREATAAIQNKIGQFTANPLIRNIVGQEKSSFNIREMMDQKKIFLVNLSKGRIGEQNAGLLGAMIVTKIYLAAMSRADVSKDVMAKLPPFYLFVDEFQNFANDSFSDILAEARKYKLNLTIAHQYIEQMEETVRDAVFGNVGTTISFRVGPLDAEVLEKIFLPTFTAEDIVNLGKYQIYLTLMIDGVGSKPFSATNMAPLPRKSITYRNEVIENSRAMYAHTRSEIQDKVEGWHATVFETAKDTKERIKKEAYLAEKAEKEKALNGGVAPSTTPTKIVIPTEIIERIEQGPKTDRGFTSNIGDRAPQSPSRPKPASPQPQSIHKIVSNKNPTDKNKSLLKDVLAKAMQKSPPTSSSTSTASNNPPPKTPPQPETNKEIPKQEDRPEESKKPREIPEDILKQILE
jgi:energy-coupling factor transporter ATP-binding protein EcfA2